MPLFVNKSFNLDVTSSEDDDIVCSVRDFVDNNGGVAVKKTLKLRSSLPAKQAAKEIAQACGYKDDTVSIHLEVLLGGDGDIVLEEQNEWISLYTICSNGAKKHNFTIHELEGKQPEKMIAQEEQQEEGFVETDQSTSENASRCGTLPVSTCQNLASDDYSYSPSIMKNEIGYVGLVNQAMTCYLNSLLQTLYMTPEFRNALYRWSFDGTEEDTEKSIPYQLQRLFLQLQMSNKKSVETTDLTKSFGWDSSEVWQQHDVQELCRVMFDALEQKWRNTVQAHLINQLYQGKMKDYVKCLECGYESARVDAYLDIPLVIRPFGSTETYSSVMEALNAFVQPEILQESNQYFCEKCNKKCNAHKGLKFMSFPYLLTLQLKRFDFDYATMNRIKLNDKMTFPEVLDLNSFVTPEDESVSQNTEEEATELSSLPTEHVDSSDEGIDEGIEVEVTGSGTSSSSDSSSVNSDAAAKNNRNASYSGREGPYVYELFSIMIHSGSASGGHYYAYIKSFKDGRWYSFNDQQVSKITYDDIRKTYGGSSFGRGFYSSAYSSSTSAYMLMYRRIDKTQNADFMQPENFPMSLKAELQRQKDKEEAERRQKEIDKSTCKIKAYCFHPVDQRKMDVRLEIHKDNTLQDATQMSWKLFELDKFVSLDCCRLVKYDEYQDSLEKSYEGEQDKAISVVLGGVKANYTFDLLLETKRPEQTFVEYKPGGVTVKAYLVDLHSKIIHPPVNVRAYHIQTVGSFKEQLAQVFGLSHPSNLRMILERFQNDLRLLVEPLKTLKAEGFYKSNKVFIEMSEDDKDFCLPYTSSRLCQLLDRYQHTIHITCTLPSPKSVEMFLLNVERSQKKAAANSLFNHIPYSISHVSPNPSSSDGGQVDEANSENDSAFYSGDTNSKHSLSGLDNASGFSLSSLSGAESSQLKQNTKASSLHPDISASTRPIYYDGITHKNESGGCTNVQYDSMKVDSVMNNFAMDEEVFADDINGEQSGSSQVSMFYSQHSTSRGSSDRKLSSSGIIPHSSSHKQLSLDLDVPDLCSKLSNVGLTSCHSDPSIYHSCLDSRGCPDSRPDSDSRDDTSASVELNLSSPGPDPDPILSSPENGYEFEDDDRDEDGNMVGVVGFVNQTTLEDSDGNERNLSEYANLQALENLNVVNKEIRGVEGGEEEDWDKEIDASCAESYVSSDHDLKSPPPPPPPPPPPLTSSKSSSSSCHSSALSSSSSAIHNNTTSGANYNGSTSSSVNGQEGEIDRKRYFSAVMKTFSETEDRVLDVSVDKRITLGSFKHKLQPYIGVACSLFKVYRVYSNNQEFESFRLSDTLSFFEDGRFNIKLGRALQAGEHRVKVFQLCVNEPESCKFLIETIFAKGMSVLESKRLITMEVQDQCAMQVSLERCRLRKKSWTNPGTVYIDNHIYDNEIPIYPNWEIFLEILDGPEELVDTSQLAVYIRQWYPSKHEIGPFKEVVLKQQTVSELKRKISAISGIPAEHVEFAKGKGTFPCEVSVLEIHTDLEWNPHVSVLNVWPLYICDDGHVVYFRDRREKLVELSDEKKKEIQQENRNSRYSQKISISPRKERALKIYTDDSSSSSSKSNTKEEKNGPQQKLKIMH